MSLPTVAPEADTGPDPGRTHRAGYVAQIMGMPISVHVRGPQPRGEEVAAAVERVFAELRETDAIFSTYRPDSQISQINAGALAVGDAHPWVAEVLGTAAVATLRTGGLFDVHLPDGDRFERGVGAASRVANQPQPHSRPRSPGPTGAAGRILDPSGLVKGWAAERAARWLRAVPDHDFCLNAGGDVVVASLEGAQPWRMGIEDPRPGGSLLGVLERRDGAMATSGSSARGDHLVDPRDGSRPSSLLSVSVLGPSLTWADVLATAAFVRGADAVDWLRGQVGYQAVAVLADGRVVTSPGLRLLPAVRSGG